MKKIRENLLSNKKLFNGLLILIFTTILFFITILELETSKLDIRVGNLVSEDIRATKDLEDPITTEKLKQDAMNRVDPKYRIQPSVQISMKNTIKDFLNLTRDIKANEELSINRKAQLLEEGQSLELTSKEISMILRMDYKGLNEFENNLMDLINYLMGNGIKETELEYEKSNLENTFESLTMKDEEKILGFRLINSTIEANEFLDKEETERKKDEAANSIEMVIIEENEIIAGKGTIIGQRELDLIKESGLLKDENSIPVGRIIGIVGLIILGMLVIGLYIYYFNNRILYNNRFLILLLILLATIIISKSFYSISPYIMPISGATLLISMLIDPKLSLLINLFLTFFLGFLMKLDTNIIAMYILGGSIGILIDIKQQQRYNIFLNGIIVGLVNVLTLLLFGLAKGIGVVDSINGGGYGFLSGLIAAVLTLGTLPIWENVFSVLTPLKLLELSNPNQPLLKKLLLEAPGTYHHSVMVGNLAEAAAEAISADPLISRVASHYHDIGKTVRPYYFAENQFGIGNPHDKLQPMQSTEIILSHRTDGIALGKEHKLPKEIIDIIEQHHGNTMVSYFYYKAKELNPDINIPMEDFRYKGRKPQTKEAAIIMMADSSEAAVRSLKDLTRDKIEDMVRKVVKGKIDEGQFQECNITLNEIEITINSFINTLTGIYHDRIEYPNMEKNLEVKS